MRHLSKSCDNDRAFNSIRIELFLELGMLFFFSPCTVYNPTKGGLQSLGVFDHTMGRPVRRLEYPAYFKRHLHFFLQTSMYISLIYSFTAAVISKGSCYQRHYYICATLDPKAPRQVMIGDVRRIEAST